MDGIEPLGAGGASDPRTAGAGAVDGHERVARRAADGLSRLLGRFSTLVLTLAAVAALVGAATYATGAWVIDGRGWATVGLVLCALPFVLCVLAWWRLRRGRRAVPRALDDLRTLARDGHGFVTSGILVDHDTQRPLGMTARSFSGLSGQLRSRREQIPSLFTAVQALTSVPALLAIALLGILGLGLLGTILLLVGLLG